MSDTPAFFATPGYGERQLKTFHYSQAVRVGARIETSGQGGWTDDFQFPHAELRDEIAQAFENVGRTLACAPEVNTIMTELFRKHMPNHAPIWTLLGVAALGDPRMRVEIRVTAIVPA